MSSIRAVLFDLDNTLYENDEALETLTMERAMRLFSPEQFAQFINALPELVQPASRPEIGMGDHEVLLNRFVPGLSAEAVEFVAALQRNWLANMFLTPDAAAALEALDLAAVPYGIVTNAPTSQRVKTIRLGLTERARCILISGEFGVDKPDPVIFHAAARALGVPQDQILFVGDSPENDIAGAHFAGMKAAWLRRGRLWPDELKGHEPDYVIDSLEEVVLIVEKANLYSILHTMGQVSPDLGSA